MSRPVRLGALLAVATLAVYAQVVQHGFVNWDDPDYVVQNPIVARGVTLDGIAWAFTHRHSATWHPLTSLSHMLDCEVFGLWPGGHHLTSVLLHVVATLLLLGVLTTLTGRAGPSAFVAGVFALHPLRAESVAWVSERKDVLAAVLWMVTIWCWTRWVRRPSAGAYAAVLAAFGLALLAKPMVVTLPLVLLLLDVWPLERRVPLRRRVVEQLPLLLMAGVVSVVTFIAQRGYGTTAADIRACRQDLMGLDENAAPRRLAPMLGGDRRRIELAFSILLTLPGTPVVYYGDEIGMGDDLSLPERDPVRTPMQWSQDANAGFSPAARGALCAPVISRGAFGYRHVNAADQRRDPSSLLNWFRRAVRVRKEAPGFGNGSWEALATGHASVLALRFEGHGRQITVLHNLSADPVRARVDGRGLVDVFADGEYETPGRTVELAGHGYRWLRRPEAM